MSLKSNKGFTLIELLVVIAIIGLLSAVVLASLNTARAKGRDAVRQSELNQLQTAVETYYADHGSYPLSPNGTWSGANAAFGSYTTNYILGITPTYIESLPIDPGTVGYGYIYTSNGTDYKIMSYGSVESKSVPQGTPEARCPSSCSVSIYTYCGETTDFAVYSSGAACW